MRLTLVVIGKDQESTARFDTSYVDCDLRLIANTKNRALSAIANEQIATSERVFGLVHADTVFRKHALEAFATDAENGHVCGIVGRAQTGEYRWCFKPYGYAEGIVRGPGLVCTLDGCSVFFRRDTGLRFDEITFNGLHCHVEDLCMQANARSISVIVSSADATHASQLPSPAWQAQYMPYRAKLNQKWGRQVVTT